MAERGEPTGSQPRSIGWQEAVAALAAERTWAETAAAMLKKRGDPNAVDRGAFLYSQAKAEVDGVIAGLIVALDRRAEPASLPDLEARLRRAMDAREALVTLVKPLVPDGTGEKDFFTALLGAGALQQLSRAVRALWLHLRDANRLAAETTRTQIEATRWRDFASITPAA